MHSATYAAFFDELSKEAKGIVELLSSKAMRKGLDPTKLPAIKQVGNIAASGNRSRAAEVAKNVSSFLKAPAQAA